MKWIDLKNTLEWPDNYQVVIGWDIDDQEWKQVSYDGSYFIDETGKPVGISHWMIPEPPKHQ